MTDVPTDMTTFVREAMPLCDTFGIEARALDAHAVVLVLPFDARWCTIGGRLHGGALMALADSAGATCAFLNLPDGATGTTTTSSTTSLIGGVSDGEVVAAARPVHIGRTTMVVETELRHGDRLVARTTQSQLVLS